MRVPAGARSVRADHRFGASGSAGAIAVISPRVGVALVGVAVATALVPPLAAAGILLARADFLLGGRPASRRDQRHRHPVCLFGNFLGERLSAADVDETRRRPRLPAA
ncbi:DUF389 domain-containing protein [Roseiarcus sp.]|uniref:DUF389 domain-containing protein n=1 Tax=Roseiarcus sp. TaxID=1969460 RepID=UPI003F944F9A